MKRLKESALCKTIAVILFLALFLGFAAGALGVGMLYSAGYYSRGMEAAREMLAENLCRNEAWLIADRLLPINDDGEPNAYLATDDNYRYEIFDSSGTLRFSTYNGEETLSTVTVPGSNWYPYYAFPEGELWGEESAASDTGSADAPQTEPLPTPLPAGVTPVPAPTESVTADTALQKTEETPTDIQPAKPLPTVTPDPMPTPHVVTPGDVYSRGRTVNFAVTCYLLRDMKARDNAMFQVRCFDFAAAHSRELVITAIGSLLLAILLFAFLMAAAGHRKGADAITPRLTEKIPFDLFTAAVALAGFAALAYFSDTMERASRSYDIVLLLILAALLFCAAVLLALWWCMSLAVRVKMGGLVRGTLCYKLLRFLGRAARAVWGWGKMIVTSIPLIWRGMLILCGAEFVGFLILAMSYSGAGPIGFFINLFVFFPLALLALISAKKLRTGASEIAKGNTAYRIDTKYLFGEFRRHAEDLNAIQSGISRAVDARLRSERMKTELITNVSHDIKTPLTSIISYVDLLSKEEIENEKAREYLEVLQRQSARLKKLTDDLVEASKASSGALPVTIEDCDLSVMLDQTAGEYGEKLTEKGLTLVVRKGEGSVPVRADVRHTQRIFDNLMGNILKYALPGTRVYLELTEGESGPAVIFRNTSRSELKLSAEELTERFVRGDASRSSEGSGLGLSIARSLAELQGGSLAVTVDGDLFKVTLGFTR
ncbi:MAG: histidine kinase dimerization/phospho-acceptor domain-containing protein [Eubacteriales bacterium]|nr:histidine kinase dimerization/phospho-acceptor domain-containing protein [Eubacteriales bacterium]